MKREREERRGVFLKEVGEKRTKKMGNDWFFSLFARAVQREKTTLPFVFWRERERYRAREMCARGQTRYGRERERHE